MRRAIIAYEKKLDQAKADLFHVSAANLSNRQRAKEPIWSMSTRLCQLGGRQILITSTRIDSLARGKAMALAMGALSRTGQAR